LDAGLPTLSFLHNFYLVHPFSLLVNQQYYSRAPCIDTSAALWNSNAKIQIARECGTDDTERGRF
jgi:hypothetical protein